MTNLQQEISRIQQAEKENRGKYPGINIWYEIAKVAYERGELIKLLSANDEYVYDVNGEQWLRYKGPDADLDLDPINIRAIVASGLDGLYREDESDEVKNTIVDVFNQMLEGTPQQVYFAVQIFYALAVGDADESSAFYDWINEISFSDALRAKLQHTIFSRKQELSQEKIFNSKRYSDGIYGKCVYYSKTLQEDGIQGFIEV